MPWVRADVAHENGAVAAGMRTPPQYQKDLAAVPDAVWREGAAVAGMIEAKAALRRRSGDRACASKQCSGDNNGLDECRHGGSSKK